MKKISIILFFVLMSVGFSSIVNAQDQTQEEAIISFFSNIVVNTDNSIDVTETIVYNSGLLERHGIYRDIYPYSSQNKEMSIENVSVVDENGNPHTFQNSYSGKEFRIKIGDADKTFRGQKTYVVTYHATKAVAQLDSLDEIYWNVTGNAWNIPIYETSANIILPNETKPIQSACYFGPKGSKNQCLEVVADIQGYMFKSPSVLGAGEGLTVAVGFQKGVVAPYSPQDEAIGFIAKYWSWFLAGILPILTLFFSLKYWYKNGRDPKGTGVIIPQYDVPDGLTPVEVGGIIKEKIEPNNISAEIIYLATKGYIKINQIEKVTLGLFKSTDYELIKTKDDFSDLPNEFDKLLMDDLFSGLSSVKLSDLKQKFYKKIPEITKLVAEALFNKGYYKNLGSMKGDSLALKIGGIFVSILIAIILSNFVARFASKEGAVLLVFGVILSIIIFSIVSRFYPAKTEKGVAMKEYILGLKDYLQIAEKDRLEFHNAPEKKPEIFEKLLPYAMVLGVADIWSKEFADIYMTPPAWYSGSHNAVFSAVVLNDFVSDFSNSAVSSLTSSPGGGSGGGGFSGGGGGGGGGGGW